MALWKPRPPARKCRRRSSADITGELSSGTVILLEDLDQLSSGYVLTGAAYNNLLEHLGTTYRGVLREVAIRVVDTAPYGLGPTVVEPVDPLFLNPTGRYYDAGDLNAEALPPTRIDVRAPGAKETMSRSAPSPCGTATSPRLPGRPRSEGSPLP